MQKYLWPLIRCKNANCRQPTRLPFPNPPNVSQGQPQPAWPAEQWKTLFACRECGRAYEYRAQDVEWASFSLPGPGQRGSATVVFCIDFVCDQEGCGNQLRLHLVRDAGTATQEIEKEVVKGHIAVQCEKGHPQKPTQIQNIDVVSEV